MKYVYPAIIEPQDGAYAVAVPDLPGCITFGETLADALEMAKDAIEMWLWDAENRAETIPPASTLETITSPENALVNLIAADTDVYRRNHETRAVKKTVSIPAWLNYKAEQANAPYSQILQEGLKEYLHIG